jgi:hypothetical protein
VKPSSVPELGIPGPNFNSPLSRAHPQTAMSGVQTRKKKMMMEAKLPVTGEILANGHAKLNGTIEKVEKEIYKQENIFIFIPNIIGRPNYSHPGSWRRN